MLRFTVLTEENAQRLTDEISSSLYSREEVTKMVASFVDESRQEGAEVAITSSHGCLLVRVFDSDGYSFVYPIELIEGSSISDALSMIADYARHELIPIYFTDTPREELNTLRRVFLHIDARAYDDDEDLFVVRVGSECDLLDEIPTVIGDGISLSPIIEADIRSYAALCRNEQVNRYWGYDYKEDEADAPDSYFVDVVNSEFRRGVALSLAVRREGGEFVGEAVIFDFDYRGGAKVAIRLLPEFQEMGIGTQALKCLISLSRDIGLSVLCAEVMRENIASVRMTEKQMPRVRETQTCIYFRLELF